MIRYQNYCFESELEAYYQQKNYNLVKKEIQFSNFPVKKKTFDNMIIGRKKTFH